MNRLPIIAGVVGVALGVTGYFAWQSTSTSQPGISLGALQANAQESSQVDTSIVQEMVLGNPDAEVTVIEYASFTCPHCKSFHQGVLPQLKTDYVDSGKVRFVYREVYFDRYGLWAGMVARCGGGDRYFPIVDMIYDQQSEWTAGGDPATIAGNLRRIGLTAGLAPETVDACMQDAEKAQAMFAVWQQNSEADSVTSTPSFVINGEKYSNMSYSQFTEILDTALGE